jgi:hypothetical protein
MRTLAVATLTLAGCGAALAQPAPWAEYRQDATGFQVVENTLSRRTLEALTDEFMQTMLDPAALGSLSQSGSNLVNSVSSEGDLNTVRQRFNGTQKITNSIALGQVNIHADIVQTGDNLAGTITGRTINLADQLLGADARQLIFNEAELGILYGSISQIGTNTANMAIAEYSIGTANQDIVRGAVQLVENRLEVAASASVAAFIEQHGTNFGNMMVSDTVESVERVFAGDQIVRNTVVLGELGGGPIIQTGTNVANYVQSSRIGTISQESTGVQLVVNEIIGPSGQLVSGPNYTQSSNDVVNMIVLSPPTGGNDNADIELSQTADYPQQQSGGNGSSGQTGNSVSVVR